MSVQSEAQLENELIQQLKNLGYHQVDLKDETQLLSNLKIQVERANGIASFSANEWAQVLNHLKAGNSFNCAKVLRNTIHWVDAKNSMEENIKEIERLWQ